MAKSTQPSYYSLISQLSYLSKYLGLGNPVILIHISVRAPKKEEAISILKKAKNMLVSLIKENGGKISGESPIE